MPQASGGRAMPYGNVINDALKDPKTTLEQMKALRDSGHSVLKEQGDLAGALKQLEAAIAKHGHK